MSRRSEEVLLSTLACSTLTNPESKHKTHHFCHKFLQIGQFKINYRNIQLRVGRRHRTPRVPQIKLPPPLGAFGCNKVEGSWLIRAGTILEQWWTKGTKWSEQAKFLNKDGQEGQSDQSTQVWNRLGHPPSAHPPCRCSFLLSLEADQLLLLPQTTFTLADPDVSWRRRHV